MTRISIHLSPASFDAAGSAHRGATPLKTHPHSGDHLARGGRPRCGCGAENLDVDFTCASSRCGEVTSWTPRRRHHVGYVRTRFIYSDRML
ncbi:MAG: hypothetical protein LBJ08_12130 [Bifidobacteriaceae bacterium]|jgi:hypothetical protein|nr:hypothetical protein [Bifidobacteriaceae bacterium]